MSEDAKIVRTALQEFREDGGIYAKVSLVPRALAALDRLEAENARLLGLVADAVNVIADCAIDSRRVWPELAALHARLTAEKSETVKPIWKGLTREQVEYVGSGQMMRDWRAENECPNCANPPHDGPCKRKAAPDAATFTYSAEAAKPEAPAMCPCGHEMVDCGPLGMNCVQGLGCPMLRPTGAPATECACRKALERVLISKDWRYAEPALATPCECAGLREKVTESRRRERCVEALIGLAHENGWNGVDNSKILEVFMRGLIDQLRVELAAANERAERAERKGWNSYPHMCRDGHEQIGHKDSEHEMCPLCVAIAERDAARELNMGPMIEPSEGALLALRKALEGE